MPASMANSKSNRGSLLQSFQPVICDGNQVRLLRSGGEYFDALVVAFEAARTSIGLETYIFADDPVALRVADALVAAAQRGISVRVVVDGIGTPALSAGIADRFVQAGVEVATYGPVRSRLSLDREHLRRLHRKLVCVDDAVAFVGGINLLGDYFDPNHGELEFPRLDYAVRLTGPLVPEVSRALARLWRQVTGQAALPSQVASTELQQSSSGPPQHPPPHPPPHPSDPPPPHAPPPHLTPAMSRQASRGLRAGLLLRDNLIHRRSIERAYLKAIGGAKHEVLIANAYFFPGRRFRRAMVEARRRGVPVRLLLQGRMEYTLPHLATQSLYPPLLDAGIEIIEYHRSFLHAKVAVVDDWATVGSSNIDPFSLLLAREANVVVFDAGFAAELRGQLLFAIADGGKPIEREQLERRSLWQRFKGWVAYRVLRLGVIVSGHGSSY
jgi:cardiolipin synthase